MLSLYISKHSYKFKWIVFIYVDKTSPKSQRPPDKIRNIGHERSFLGQFCLKTPKIYSPLLLL